MQIPFFFLQVFNTYFVGLNSSGLSPPPSPPSITCYEFIIVASVENIAALKLGKTLVAAWRSSLRSAVHNWH